MEEIIAIYDAPTLSADRAVSARTCFIRAGRPIFITDDGAVDQHSAPCYEKASVGQGGEVWQNAKAFIFPGWNMARRSPT
ncbi:MAG: hypothetical protein ACXWWP_06900, partial [Candidatus Binatia bacterium]